mmetsp:Transcript_19263/g.41761  ORF Transcript_19263/g.41761 Transcript_19263/m.41761 type:complete len:1654 (+) Transcript_19263:272-5233(+)|eukprot:CAMPEP_0172329240 /NCGR_PEP_ID=MMETSP1058-20130122/60778_1 /TAXON_ID=83371 /ORGANISM="Detonula confervacea, Strain CCMP 353" /LENGTH=1653 /DNA_ID=CAMNT_0013046403 /DNA_START=235 /DNA_END=5196 /DNA_ORIENTATION=-
MTASSTGNSNGKGNMILSYENDDNASTTNSTTISTTTKINKIVDFYRTVPILHLNGTPLPPSLTKLARPNQTLLNFLRNECGLTGSKLGCGEGGCGACTVLLSRYSSNDGRIIHRTVNACLFPVLAADGCHITTIEGVGSWRHSNNANTANIKAASNGKQQQEDHLHPIQRAMVDLHGSQCGYCTPGIIMALYGLLTVPAISDHDGAVVGPTVSHLEEHLDGNLCRCTGYRPIWDAARALCVVDTDINIEDAATGVGPCGTPCRECPEREVCEMDANVHDKIIDDEEKENCSNNNDGRGESEVVCSSSESKVADYQSILQQTTTTSVKHDGNGDEHYWWDQPNQMFPKELLPSSSNDNDDDTHIGDIQKQLAQPLMVVDTSIHNGGTWYQPTTLEGLLDLFREFSDDDNGGGIKMVVGNTEVGIETKFKQMSYPRMIHASVKIHTLHDIFGTEGHLVVGGCASLSMLQGVCHEWMTMTTDADASASDANADANDSANDGDVAAAAQKKSRTAKPIHDMLRWFASTQIRNVACLGGNLATASPISDMNPLLCALNATLILASRPSKPDGAVLTPGGITRRHVRVSDFFVGYRKVDKRKVEVIERVDIPLLATHFEYCAPFKQARRREDDISIVTCGMSIKLGPSNEEEKKNNGCCCCWMIQDVRIAYGGMAPVTKLAKDTMMCMIGKPFEESTFEEARVVLQKEFKMPEDVPGGQSEYRLTLACSFLHKFYLYCVGELRKDVVAASVVTGGSFPPVPTIASEEESGMGTGFVSAPKPSIGGNQSYPVPKVAVGLEAKHLGILDGSSDDGKKTKEVPLAAMAAAKKSEEFSSNKKQNVVVGQAATHASGPLHCTGEALYADDIPAPANLLHGYLIMASQCHAKLVSVDITPALQIPGVAAAFTHKDIVALGGDNRMGPVMLDDVAFLPIGETVSFVGQVLGIVVGVSQEIAERGARAVAVEYNSEELEGKAVVSIEDAIEANSFWVDQILTMKSGGNVREILDQEQQTQTTVDGKKIVVVEGSMRSGGQEHFYLEPNSTLAIPSESATNLTIYASTQAPTKTQDFCARVTNTPAAKVVVRMKRMGGGFGGKETRSVFCSVAAAVAAKLTNRPVRLTLNRDTDMSITGGRHAFLAKYKAGAIVNEEDGSVKLHGLDVQLYNNGGCKFDLTGPVLARALFHVDNCYHWPNFLSVGTPCKTSQPPHTAFRGFGGPQGLVVTEHIMDHLALACNVSGDKLRRENMYTLEDATPFGMRFGGEFTGKWNVPGMWDRFYKEMDVPGRRKAAAEFNKKNKWVKRGVGFIPTKFGIAFTAKFMNQGGSLVHVYTDGTVLVSHGGTEMGQGLHTKVCQVAAQVFGIPLDHVYVNDSSTDKVANTLPSAASMSTDMYGMATLDACQQILKRLAPIRDSLPPNATFGEVAKKAFFERVDMSAHGFYTLDDNRCGYDWDKDAPEDYPANLPENSWKGTPFNYFTQGVALAEVEIDVLTGDHKTIAADVLVDVGSSINPAIDIGQIEGAFIQGMGWSTIEEVVYADDDHTWIRPRARVFTTGPGTYKIPAFNDVPEKFNVSLLENVDNPFAVHSSKAIGEPPFFLGCSVFYAIKDAVAAARGEGSDSSGYFEFRLPATSERIRMACGDKISSECIASGTSASFQPKGSF